MTIDNQELSIQNPIPRKQAIITFFRISSFQFLANLRRGIFYIYISLYLRFFLGLSVTASTLYAFVPMICNTTFQIFVWGRVSDKFQRRRSLILLGEYVAGICIVLIWIIHRYVGSLQLGGYLLIGGLGVLEMFWSMSNVGFSALVCDLYPAIERGTVMGRIASVSNIGSIVGTFLGGILYDGMGLHYSGWGYYEGSIFFITAAFIFISTIPMWKAPEGGVCQETPDLLLTTSGSTPPPTVLPKESEKTIPASRSILLCYILFVMSVFIMNFGRYSTDTIFSQYMSLETSFHVTPIQLSMIYNIGTLAVIIVGLFIGTMGKKWGNGFVLLIGVGIGIGSILYFALGRSLWGIFISYFTYCLADITISVTAYAYAAQLIPSAYRGRWFGWFNSTTFLAWGLSGTLTAGPLVDGLLIRGFEAITAYQWAFHLANIITFGGIILFGILLFVRKKLQI